MKKTIALIAGVSLCLVASPFHLRAADATTPTPAPATTPGQTVGKKHMDVNAWLNAHPKIKAKVLAKFDANHNGVLDGDEIPAFLKWLKERREKRMEAGGGKAGQGGQTTTTTPPAITSPNVQ